MDVLRTRPPMKIFKVEQVHMEAGGSLDTLVPDYLGQEWGLIVLHMLLE